ncbi:MAG: SDR family NAD(P)-dependent oxidoreductase [Brevundimonas sp.]
MAEPPPLQALIGSLIFYGRFAPSFTRIGYLARGLPLRPVKTRADGQVWLVSGATGGLGLATARRAARRGATVLAVGRNRGALDRLAATVPTGAIVPVVCDLSDMRAVAALPAAPELAARTVDVLVKNIGVLIRDFSRTPDGLETSYATNLLGHHILTGGLVAAGRLARGAVILNVVSGGLYSVPLNTRMLNIPEALYNGFAAYASHKRAQLALTDHWRGEFADLGVRTYAVHPGWADTPGVRTSLPVFRRLLGPILRDALQGADTIDWLAAARPPEAIDQVWFDRRPRPAHAFAHTRKPAATTAQLLDVLAADVARLGLADKSPGSPRRNAAARQRHP